MGTIVLTTFAVMALLAVLGAPLFYVAWRQGRRVTVRNFAFGGLGIGVMSGLLAGASERQVQQCLDAGNSDCVDSGTVGLQIVFVVGFTLAAWILGYLMWRDR